MYILALIPKVQNDGIQPSNSAYYVELLSLNYQGENSASFQKKNGLVSVTP